MGEIRPGAAHVGRPQTFQSGGRSWTLARWTRSVWSDFLEWAKPLIPDPRQTAVEFLKMIPDKPENTAVREAIVIKALHDADEYLSEASPKVLALLAAPAGMVKIVQLLLRPAHGPISEDDVYEIVTGADQKELSTAVEACNGTPPPKDDAAPSPASR